METVELTVYNIRELPDKARQKAIDNHRQWAADGFAWWDEVYGDYKEKLENMGFLDAEIWFSGFSYQGDGACFDAAIDLDKLINWVSDTSKYRHLLPFIADRQITARIEKNLLARGYNHQGTRYLQLDYSFGPERHPRAAQLCENLNDELEEIRYELSREIYRSLESEYADITSPDNVEETLYLCNVQFTENGEVFRY